MAKSRILIVEDSPELVEVLSYNLVAVGYETFVARDGLDGLRQAQSKLPDIVLLDLMLPIMDGLELCRQLRADPATRGIRIVMLTAKSEEADQILGLATGADDYVTKPFSFKVLLERIKAIERRSQPELKEEFEIECQGIRIDRRGHRAWAADVPMQLTLSEFRLLEAFLSRPGRVFSRVELVERALGGGGLVLERTVDVHIRALRLKLGSRAGLIQTVRRAGYRFRDSATAPADPELGADEPPQS